MGEGYERSKGAIVDVIGICTGKERSVAGY